MSDYVRVYNLTIKDSLPTGNSNKVIKGTELDVELNAAAAAIASKADSNDPTFTGTPVAPTAAAGTNTTQIATTAFVLTNGVPSGGVGFGVRASPTSTVLRSIAAGTGVSVTNGDGVSGNPTIANTGVLSVNSQAGALSLTAGSGITATTTTGSVALAPTSGYNGYGVRTVSTSDPSGGSNGDIWYKV
jgi:hypothetical protein